MISAILNLAIHGVEIWHYDATAFDGSHDTKMTCLFANIYIARFTIGI